MYALLAKNVEKPQPNRLKNGYTIEVPNKMYIEANETRQVVFDLCLQAPAGGEVIMTVHPQYKSIFKITHYTLGCLRYFNPMICMVQNLTDHVQYISRTSSVFFATVLANLETTLLEVEQNERGKQLVKASKRQKYGIDVDWLVIEEQKELEKRWEESGIMSKTHPETVSASAVTSLASSSSSNHSGLLCGAQRSPAPKGIETCSPQAGISTRSTSAKKLAGKFEIFKNNDMYNLDVIPPFERFAEGADKRAIKPTNAFSSTPKRKVPRAKRILEFGEEEVSDFTADEVSDSDERSKAGAVPQSSVAAAATPQEGKEMSAAAMAKILQAPARKLRK